MENISSFLNGITAIGFDLDRTLVSSFMDNPEKDYHEWEVLPERSEAILLLKRAGIEIGVVTNQGSVAFGLVEHREFTEIKMPAVAKLLGLGQAFFNPTAKVRANGFPVWVCYAHPKGSEEYRTPEMLVRRKPSGAMIREALAYHGVSSDEYLFVGDSEEDRLAAEDAGVRFVYAEEFFR